MKWKRTAMSLALAGCMMATTVPVTAFAANETTMASEQQAGTGTKITSFSIAESKYTVAKGNDVAVNAMYKLATDVTSDIKTANIKWEIEDPSIADFKSGSTGKFVTINAKKVGKTTLKATFGGDNNTKTWEASCEIEVVEPTTSSKIELDKSSATLYTDGTKTSETEVSLTAKLNGSEQNPTMTWSVSDTNAVEITGNTQATKTIKIKSSVSSYPDSVLVTVEFTNKDNEVLQDTCEIALKQKAATLDTIKVYKVGDDSFTEITDNSTTIAVGEDLTTKAVCYSGNGQDKYSGATVTWTSQNPAVATVNNGVITGVAKGETNITATAKAADGTTVQKTFKVTVDDATVALNDIKISATKLTVAANEDVNLSVTYDPTNATVKAKDVTWTIANPQGKAVLEKKTDEDTGYEIKGSFKANKVGTATVTVTVKGVDAEGNEVTKTRTCSVVVTKGGASQVTGFQVQIPQRVTLTVDHPVELGKNYVKLVNENNVDIKDEDIAWSVSPADAAKVVEGYLIPLKADTSITLSAKINNIDGSVVCKATANVDSDDKDNVTSVKFADMDTSSIAMVVGQKATNVATVNKKETDSSTYTVVYTSSNPAVATVDNEENSAKDMVVGQVKALAAGTTTITATVGNHSASYTVTVVDPKDPSVTGFVDVPSTAWYYDVVNEAVAKGLMKGVGNNKFEPMGTVERSQVAQIIWNMAGNPTVTGAPAFTDVAADAWYAQPVKWASDQKIVNGIGGNKFGPALAVTREDFVTMLYRYAKTPATTGDLSKFSDAGKVAPHAQDAMKWAVSTGLVNGDDKGQLNPKSTLSRAEAAAIVVRYAK